jgi:tRNA(Ile)-lysidine synthase
LHPFETHLADVWQPAEWQDLTVLLAVSGGADSVALLRAVATLKTGGIGRVCVAHFNHKLRSSAEDDERFVADLCKLLGILCEIGAADVAQLAADASEGIELAARRSRHRFLQDAAGRLGARFVVTAHTADDQAETILHRIVRGTGVSGLAGIKRSRRFGPATLLRPMLTVRRTEIEDYLRDIGQTFCDDPSNTDHRFTRNRIRHELLPLLARHYNSAAADALLRLGGLAAEVQEIIVEIANKLCEETVNFKNKNIVEIDAAALAGQPEYLLRELFVLVWRRQSWPMQAMGYGQWQDLAQMIMLSKAATLYSTTTSKKIFPGNIQADARDCRLFLTRME